MKKNGFLIFLFIVTITASFYGFFNYEEVKATPVKLSIFSSSDVDLKLEQVDAFKAKGEITDEVKHRKINMKVNESCGELVNGNDSLIPISSVYVQVPDQGVIQAVDGYYEDISIILESKVLSAKNCHLIVFEDKIVLIGESAETSFDSYKPKDQQGVKLGRILADSMKQDQERKVMSLKNVVIELNLTEGTSSEQNNYPLP